MLQYAKIMECWWRMNKYWALVDWWEGKYGTWRKTCHFVFHKSHMTLSGLYPNPNEVAWDLSQPKWSGLGSIPTYLSDRPETNHAM